MTANGILQILFFFLLVLLVTKPLGHFMARVFEGEKTLLDPVFKPIERALYKVCGIDEKQDMKWTTYAFAMLHVQRCGHRPDLWAAAFAGFAAVQPENISAAKT